MRIIDEKKSVDLSEKVTVELSLLELALINGAMGITNRRGRQSAIRRELTDGYIIQEGVYDTMIHEEDVNNKTHEMYSDMRDYLIDKGVFR